MSVNASSRTARIARYALLLAVALILSWVEAILPFQIPVPGVKLGLANIASLYVLYTYPFPQTLGFGVLRVLLSGLFLGRLSGVIFSLCGTVLSLCGMGLLRKCSCFSPLGVSVAGAVLHGVGQLCAASLLLSPTVWSVLPWMGLSSACCGILVWLPFGILEGYSSLRPRKVGENLNKD